MFRFLKSTRDLPSRIRRYGARRVSGFAVNQHNSGIQWVESNRSLINSFLYLGDGGHPPVLEWSIILFEYRWSTEVWILPRDTLGEGSVGYLSRNGRYHGPPGFIQRDAGIPLVLRSPKSTSIVICDRIPAPDCNDGEPLRPWVAYSIPFFNAVYTGGILDPASADFVIEELGNFFSAVEVRTSD